MEGFSHVSLVKWKPLTEVGDDSCELLEGPEGFVLEGDSLRTGAAMMVASYSIRCDPRWATISVQIRVRLPQPGGRLELQADGHGRWWRDGEPAEDLEGCVDVDLGCTPATNTLPICRLGLGVGEEAEILAAWVKFPELEVRPLRQWYRRLAPDRYEYASNTFRAELDIDEQGLVLDYPGAWVRERDDT